MDRSTHHYNYTLQEAFTNHTVKAMVGQRRSQVYKGCVRRIIDRFRKRPVLRETVTIRAWTTAVGNQRSNPTNLDPNNLDPLNINHKLARGGKYYLASFI